MTGETGCYAAFFRARAVLLATVIAALGCATSAETLNRAQADLQDREPNRALTRFREVAAAECRDGDSTVCCSALLGEADALAALDERQSAVVAYRRVRGQCPYDMTVRRKLFAVEHPNEPTRADLPGTLTFKIEHRFGSLGTRAKLIWVGLFFDGEAIGREAIATRPGEHQVDVDAFLELSGGSGKPSRRLRLSAQKAFTIPASGPSAQLQTLAILHYSENNAESLLEARYSLTLDVANPEPLGTPSQARTGVTNRELAPILEQHLGMNLRVSGDRPKIPREKLRSGPGWAVTLELCITPEGRVGTLLFLDLSLAREPRVDAAIVEALRRWEYGRYLLNGVPQGFCHPLRIDLAER